MKNRKNIIIIAFLVALLVMAVGYSTFATELTFNGNAEITGEWDVRITDMKVTSVSDGCDAGKPEFTDTTINFDSKLEKPGDKITYLITIENLGTIDAVLSNIQIIPDDINGTKAITYRIINPVLELPKSSSTTMEITVEYDPTTTENPDVKTKSITGVIEYSQK